MAQMLATNLEAEGWQHFKSTVELDLKHHVLHKAKRADCLAASYWADLEWRSKRREEIERAVGFFLEQTTCISSAESLDQAAADLAAFKLKVKQHPLVKADKSDIAPWLANANSSQPCPHWHTDLVEGTFSIALCCAHLKVWHI